MIYSVGLSDDFADKLTEFVLSAAKDDYFKLAQIQIILPTKRACRTVKEAFLRASDGHSLLLPKLTALYELETLAEDIPPAMPALERTLLLTKLCLAKPNIQTPDKAVMVAMGLGTLLDEFYQYEADISKISTLVTERQFADHWNETASFLDILHTVWPQILAERGQIDEMDRTIRLIKSYAYQWRQNPPAHPLIMAGFDGAIPAVIELAKTVHALPKGTLFLNGLDTGLDEKMFNALPDTHYQYSLKKLLQGLDVSPRQVQRLGHTNVPAETLIREALKPAEETHTWRYVQDITPEALAHVKRLECENPGAEALTVALKLREVLETPSKTAAFVTTDRILARRVMLEMKRWGVELDDSAGTPLHQTEVGIYLSLVVNVGINVGDGNALLALLKHPLSADGLNPMSLRLKIKSAEKKTRMAHAKLDYKTNTDLSSFGDRFQNNILVPFAELLREHIRVAEELATSSDRSGIARLWSDDAGKTAFNLFTELLTYGDIIGEIEPRFYPEMFQLLMSGISVRPRFGMHPRLDILGPIEARLHHADVMIVGGLNEGSFPQLPEVGPWLNRPMRKALGLPALENKIAVSAMDFATCFCAKEVYLTRALKADGAPTISSRFLSRLLAVLQSTDLHWPAQTGYLATLLDKPNFPMPIVRPAPKPPVSARPRSLSVTKIELWMRDPYAIYARYILKLYPLDDLEQLSKQQVFGMAVHNALERFLKENSHATDFNRLMNFGLDSLKTHGFDTGDLAFYLPKFEQMAKWFLARQEERFNAVSISFTEQKGSVVLDLPSGDFTLSGTADRIDLLSDGTVEIIDYKTGAAPKSKEVHAGYAPQLALEAYILTQKGFADVQACKVSQLSYWKLSGKENGGKITSLIEDGKADELVQKTVAGLKQLITTFDDEQVPYESCPAPEKAPKYNDYEHLSRAKEWLTKEDEEEDV